MTAPMAASMASEDGGWDPRRENDKDALEMGILGAVLGMSVGAYLTMTGLGGPAAALVAILARFGNQLSLQLPAVLNELGWTDLSPVVGFGIIGFFVGFLSVKLTYTDPPPDPQPVRG